MNEFLGGGGTDAPGADDSEDEVVAARPSVSYDEIFSKGLIDTSDPEVSLVRNSPRCPVSKYWETLSKGREAIIMNERAKMRGLSA